MLDGSNDAVADFRIGCKIPKDFCQVITRKAIHKVVDSPYHLVTRKVRHAGFEVRLGHFVEA
jgi:hypothetical protein